MHKAYKFRLYPNTNQKILINKTFGCVRFVYNYFLNECRKKGYQKSFDMCKALKELENEYSFFKEVDTISLDEVIKNVKNNFDDEKSKEELKLGSCFPCDFSSSFEKIEEKERNKLIYEVLNCSSLNKREKEIIALRYGFIDGKVLSLQEIANHYNLSRERIRQLEEGALKKIRRNDMVDDLAIYTDDCDRAENKLKEYRKRYNTKCRCFLSTK